MTTRLRLESGGWWRYSKYILRHGYICPDPDAELQEYDPWDLYESQRKSGKRSNASYVALIRLVERLAEEGFDADWAVTWLSHRRGTYEDPSNQVVPPFEQVNIPEEASQLILDWSSAHGLLGILSQFAVAISTVVNIEESCGWVFLAGAGKQKYDFGIGTFTRVGGRWEPTSVSCDARSVPGPDGSGTLEAFRGERPKVTPFVTGGMMPLRNLVTNLDRFFPTLDSSVGVPLYPKPNTKGFWRDYREALPDWILLASEVVAAIKAQHPNSLEYYLSSATQKISTQEDGSRRLSIAYPSLIASLVGMAVQDDILGSRLKPCLTCSYSLLTDNESAIYCSERCKWRDLKAAQRRRAQEKAAVEKARKNAKTKTRK